jgi:hypothetical protein
MMKVLFFIGVWFSCIVLGLMFMRGATYKGNIAEDPDYYGKE